eukprot:1619273-Pyramimonas_sp.AAC.1
MEPLAQPRKNLAAVWRVADASLGQASKLASSAESVTGATHTGKTVVIEVNHNAAVSEGSQLERIDSELAGAHSWSGLHLLAGTTQA